MANAAPTKPHIAMTDKAVWQCGDAHLARSGRSWKQAYDRWLLASLRDAASVANLCQPAAPVTKKVGRPRKELMPMGWYVAEQAKKDGQADKVRDSDPVAKWATKVTAPATGNPASPATAPKKAKLAKLHKIASSVPAPQLRQPGSDKPIASKPAPKASAIDQPSYHESMIRQAPVPTRREYSPSADLLRNMDRAAAVQKPLISISAIDRSAS